ncbi:MAG: NAD+ synthase [Methylophilaceae bacterium]
MKIAIAQLNAVVGDISGNADKIIQFATEAKQHGASLLITPELALCGYPPEDLLFRQDFIDANQKILTRIAKTLPDMTVIIGHIHQVNKQLFNAASILQDGEIVSTYHKQVLPNYSVFDEERYFEPGNQPLVFDLEDTRYGVMVCADGWEPGPAEQAKLAGAEFLIALNASPYRMDKLSTRYEVFSDRVKETRLPIIYTNLVGGQDELVFDGASFVLNSQAEVTHQLPSFVESLSYVEVKDKQPLATKLISPLSLEAMVYNALKLGLTDYVNKNGFPSVVLGLSGGIDSALTLAIAVDALGADRVKVLMMSSQYTASMSVDDAVEMAKLVDVDYSLIPIKSLFEGFKDALSEEFEGKPEDTTEENLQARIRGILLMALSNKFGGIVLTTGNKSEVAVGYSTLYGDMAGGFSLLKDVPKTLVYKLANYRNNISRVIPERIITRPPSAELRDDQTDQDSLPPYEILDGIMQAYVEDDLSLKAIEQLGYSEADIKRVTSLIDRNEYKRRQAPIGVRITQRGFGKDRRYPITCKLNFN